MEKLFCILEQGKYVNDPLTIKHKEVFNTSFSDFYRLNWYTSEDPNANWHASNITLSQGKNILYQNVPKIYKYYIFIDDDVDIQLENSAIDKVTVAEKLKCLLEKYNPLHATLYRRHNAWGSWHINSIRDLHNKYRREAWPIYGFDLDCDIYHHSYINAVLPIKYHGCYKCLTYTQYICYKLHPEKQMMLSGLIVTNTRQSNHSNELSLPQSNDGFSLTVSFLRDLKKCRLNENAHNILNNEYAIPSINAAIYLNVIDNDEIIFDKDRLKEILN